MRNLDSCRCWRWTLCPCKVRNKFLVNFWNRTILLCIPRIIEIVGILFWWFLEHWIWTWKPCDFFLVIDYVFVTINMNTVGFNSISNNGNLHSVSLKFCSWMNDHESGKEFQIKIPTTQSHGHTVTVQILLLLVSALQGCHHQGALTMVKVELSKWSVGCTTATHFHTY